MTLREPDALRLALVEAEGAPATGPPLVVARQADADIIQDLEDLLPGDAVLPEGEYRADRRLATDVAAAFLISPNADVGVSLGVAKPGFKRFIFGCSVHHRICGLGSAPP